MKSLFSSHIFMFPFRFDWNDKGFEKEFEFYKSIDEHLEKRIDLQGLHQQLTKQNLWSYKEFQIEEQKEKHLFYSEYTYFYDYARDAIYNQSKVFDPQAISHFYCREDFYQKGKIFRLKTQKREEAYELEIDNVSLRVFQTGVAILAIELKNNNYPDFQDILNINDFGRRVYPQFISKTNQTVPSEYMQGVKGAFLADSIEIGEFQETFNYKDFSDTKIGEHIMKLLGGEIFSQNKQELSRFYIQPSLDDRMFVLSWYGNSAKASQLQDKKSLYKSSDDWYQYLFVDNNGATVQNQKMKKSLLKHGTYDRWSNYKTLYGISRYSCVLLTDASKFSKDKLRVDLETMYFQMMILLLAIRTSVLRFSDEVAALASSVELDADKLTQLYQRYLVFYNRLYFKEVTHQDQGIELYNLARKQMTIDEHIEKLDSKFTKLFEFAELQARKRQEKLEKERLIIEKEADAKQSAKMDKLTIMGAIFLPPSLMIAWFSMGIFEYEQSETSLYIAVISIVISVLLTISFINYKEKANKIKEMILPAIVITIITMLMALIPIKLIGEKKNKVNDVNITNSVLKIKNE
ncbi:MAG TPA: hypothetical protein ENK82_00095 [Campylobacterales bacterium]|nr:hypothetical protein [Campylobacterales bacterium]